MRKPKPPAPPKPVRVMNGDELAAVVTSDYCQITIRPESGWKVEQCTINVAMRRLGEPTPLERQPGQQPPTARRKRPARPAPAPPATGEPKP